MAVCGAEKFSEVEAILKKDMKLGILPPFTDLDIRKRVCPEETLAGAAGFIVILEHYTPETYKKRTGLYGNISPAASGEDYHRTVGKKLNRLVEELMAADPEGTYLAYVDNSPFSEKHVAIRAGLGRLMHKAFFIQESLVPGAISASFSRTGIRNFSGWRRERIMKTAGLTAAGPAAPVNASVREARLRPKG